MKKLYMFLFSFVLLFLGGCSYKNSTINIEPYTVNFMSFTNHNKKIFINSIEDKRTNKQIIGIVTNDQGDNLGYSTTDTNFVIWYKTALAKALKANGFEVVRSKKRADLQISLQLNNLLVTFNKSILTKENLTGDITLTLIIKKAKETITKNISENLKKYNGFTISQKTFKNEIKTLLDDSIKMIIQNISNI